MTWLKKDDQFPDHRKIRRLSDGAYRLHDTALCACARDETDGLLTEEDYDELRHADRLREHISELVSAGLWEPIDGGGWRMHDYLDYNPSHAQQEAERAAARERQRRRRERRIGIASDETPSQSDDESRRESRRDIQRESRRVSQGVSRPPVPSRPVPSRTNTPSGVLGGARKRGTRLPNDFVPSEKSRQIILAEHPALDLRREHAKFVDYWVSVPGQRGVRIDWDATWRNWMRRAGEQGSSRTSTRQQQTDELFAAAMTRAQAREAAAKDGQPIIEGVIL